MSRLILNSIPNPQLNWFSGWGSSIFFFFFYYVVDKPT